MTETTPLLITDQIKVFCQEVCPDNEPVYVDVSPQPGAVTTRCFENVRNHIEKNGGDIQHGWILWEMPDLLCTFEFHAVWVNEHGGYLDITPTADGESAILFLPDNQRIFQGKRIRNIRKPLADNEEVRSIMQESTVMETMIERLYDGALNKSRASQSKIVKKVGRNQSCPCGSGAKYKKCCGSPARTGQRVLGAR